MFLSFVLVGLPSFSGSLLGVGFSQGYPLPFIPFIVFVVHGVRSESFLQQGSSLVVSSVTYPNLCCRHLLNLFDATVWLTNCL